MAQQSLAVVPAQLGFLAIYNPTLGNETSNDVVEDQIVYYTSLSTPLLAAHQPQAQSQSDRKQSTWDSSKDKLSQEERNERLRQVGLAQGMVEFGRSFSGDHPVDMIETEKSRVILHELEPGWWILASIDLTKLPLAGRSGTASMGEGKDDGEEIAFEYSSREVKPAALLLQDLLRAHSVFLLHHDSSLSSMFVRTRRPKFMGMLARYWNLFLSTWNVMLHGNPARNIFGGIRVAACGELGIGVGEEDRGSGEREVLEGLVDRIEGLVDLVVSKFGDGTPGGSSSGEQAERQPWLGTGRDPGVEDGAIFLGVGALSRHSLRDITYWMEDLYTWDQHAYGVLDNSKSTRSTTRSRRQSVGSQQAQAQEKARQAQGRLMSPPPPIAGHQATSGSKPAGPQDQESAHSKGRRIAATSDSKSSEQGSQDGGVNKFVSYLKMGYGTHWGIGGSSGASTAQATGTSVEYSDGQPATPRQSQESMGHYLIGLIGDVEETGGSDPEDRFSDNLGNPDANSRTLLRTLTVELESEGRDRSESQITRDLGSHDNELGIRAVDVDGRTVGESARLIFDNQDRNKTKQMRVVVYVNRPFIYTFLFKLRTDSLAWDGLYRSLHYQLAPLRKPLMQSTLYRPQKPEGITGSGASAQIYDLVWDPQAMTVHCTIPNIPEPASSLSSSAEADQVWSRLDALNTHIQILNTYSATHSDLSELERTAKTSRGWWIVWTRILERVTRPAMPKRASSGVVPQATGQQPASDGSSSTKQIQDPENHKGGGEDDDDDDMTPTQEVVVKKEIFLVRRAGDHAGSAGIGAGLGVRGVSVTAGSGGYWSDGANRLAQGIGVDTRRYIEGLLSLNR
jgi:hypothetical protein